jgi:hypothetical protein
MSSRFTFEDESQKEKEKEKDMQMDKGGLMKNMMKQNLIKTSQEEGKDGVMGQISKTEE